MSTETTKKKIKIDNGTTFGRAYTDKAVDELLKGVGGQKVKTIAITELLDANDIQAFIETLQDALNTFSYAFKINVNSADYINDYEYIFVDTSAINYSGGLLFMRSVGINGFPTAYTLVFNHTTYSGTSSQESEVIAITSACIINQTLNVTTIEGNHLIPHYDNASKEKYLGVNTNGELEWSNNGLGRTATLFGKHGILIPKNSNDTNIDLYVHNIVLKDNATTPTKQIFLTIESSNNIVVDSLTDLNTLLTTNKRVIGCSGYTDSDDIKAIDWQGAYASSKYITKTASTSLSEFTIISDSVTTV